MLKRQINNNTPQYYYCDGTASESTNADNNITFDIIIIEHKQWSTMPLVSVWL